MNIKYVSYILIQLMIINFGVITYFGRRDCIELSKYRRLFQGTKHSYN